MRGEFFVTLTAVFLLGSAQLWADSQDRKGPPAPIISGSDTTVSGERRNPGIPGDRPHKRDGNHREKLEQAKQRHEVLHQRWEERDRNIQEKLTQMIEKHPGKADEIKQRYAERKKRIEEKHQRWHERMQEHAAKMKARVQERRQNRPGPGGNRVS